MIAGGQIDFMQEFLRRKQLMKKLIRLFAFLALSAAPVMAQGYARFDLSAGGSFRVYQQSEKASDSKIGMPGWYASADYNFHKFRNHFGVEIEGSGNYRNQGYYGRTSVYTFFAGPRIYPFGHHKLTPYGHVLFGGGYYRNVIPPAGGADFTTLRTYGSKAWEAGGGLDLNIKKHWGVRMLELDYARTRFYSYNIKQANYRASIGVIYRFGGR
jgi:hypothetical protein